MRMRKLGRTGYQVSEIGFGAWGLGSAEWRGVDARSAQRALYVAMEAGVNYIDTARRFGDSERLIGEVVRDLRARDWAIVATKVEPLSSAWVADKDVALEREFPAGYVVKSVEDSLRAQRAEVLPIAQLGVWHDAWLESKAWPELRGTMERLVREGKVLHWGIWVNAHDPGSALSVLAEPVIETMQTGYNVFDRGLERDRELLLRAREHEVGVIACSPFDRGALTGELTAESTFPAGDMRQEYFGGARLAQVEARVGKLRKLLGDEASTLPALALRMCLSQPDVATVIAGMRRVEHVHENLAVSDGRSLSEELLSRLREHAWERNWWKKEEPAPSSPQGAPSSLGARR